MAVPGDDGGEQDVGVTPLPVMAGTKPAIHVFSGLGSKERIE
jgi:hypothetical protein